MSNDFVSNYVADAAARLFDAPRPPKLAFCDYIAHRIQQILRTPDLDHPIVASVGHVKWDLHPTEGYFVSSKKTLRVIDRNGKQYLVTVEEIKEEPKAVNLVIDGWHDTAPCDSEPSHD